GGDEGGVALPDGGCRQEVGGLMTGEDVADQIGAAAGGDEGGGQTAPLVVASARVVVVVVVALFAEVGGGDPGQAFEDGLSVVLGLVRGVDQDVVDLVVAVQ